MEIERVEGERDLVNQRKKQIIEAIDKSVVDKVNIKVLVATTLRKNTKNQFKH